MALNRNVSEMQGMSFPGQGLNRYPAGTRSKEEGPALPTGRGTPKNKDVLEREEMQSMSFTFGESVRLGFFN